MSHRRVMPCACLRRLSARSHLVTGRPPCVTAAHAHASRYRTHVLVYPPPSSIRARRSPVCLCLCLYLCPYPALLRSAALRQKQGLLWVRPRPWNARPPRLSVSPCNDLPRGCFGGAWDVHLPCVQKRCLYVGSQTVLRATNSPHTGGKGDGGFGVGTLTHGRLAKCNAPDMEKKPLSAFQPHIVKPCIMNLACHHRLTSPVRRAPATAAPTHPCVRSHKDGSPSRRTRAEAGSPAPGFQGPPSSLRHPLPPPPRVSVPQERCNTQRSQRAFFSLVAATTLPPPPPPRANGGIGNASVVAVSMYVHVLAYVLESLPDPLAAPRLHGAETLHDGCMGWDGMGMRTRPAR